MSEIADFIEVQYRRIEQAAKQVRQPYRLYVDSDGRVSEPKHVDDLYGEHDGEYEQWADGGDRMPNHITNWSLIYDPAAVLADIESKRAILKMFTPPEREPETDEELHARFAHPAYEYETTEGQRKAWDDADEPPWGDDGPDYTWKRNVDAGRDGWERFDYTEESYWRRRLPAGQERVEKDPLVLRLLAAPFSGEPGYKETWAV